ncbi:MAG: ribonuclease HI, partial [Chloroflexi bacterium]|nr:ribonuclease HI [Chloroflexota bacterium]
IVGLKALKRRCEVTLYSDSQLLVNSISQGWAYSWRKKGWRKGRKWVPNADLWQQLLELCDQQNVEFIWVQAHQGIVENERADQLSMAAAQRDNLAIDATYEAGDTQIKPTSLF